MNCGEFDRLWNERLDARGALPEGDARALELAEAHATACPGCRALAARYQLLGHAVAALGPPPVPPEGFAERVLAAARTQDARPLTVARPVTSWSPARLARLAAAAALVAAIALGLRDRVRPGRPPQPVSAPAPVEAVRAIDLDDLNEALAAATSATLDLAREASAPAARVGRQVLFAANLPGSPDSSATSGETELPVGGSDTAEVLQGVGDRVHAGVAPLEGTARHAFGFLLGAPPDDNLAPGPVTRPADGA